MPTPVFIFLNALGKTFSSSADDILKYASYLSKKKTKKQKQQNKQTKKKKKTTGFDILWKLSPMRQYTWNVKSCFLGKNSINFSSAELAKSLVKAKSPPLKLSLGKLRRLRRDCACAVSIHRDRLCHEKTHLSNLLWNNQSLISITIGSII